MEVIMNNSIYEQAKSFKKKYPPKITVYTPNPKPRAVSIFLRDGLNSALSCVSICFVKTKYPKGISKNSTILTSDFIAYCGCKIPSTAVIASEQKITENKT